MEPQPRRPQSSTLRFCPAMEFNIHESLRPYGTNNPPSGAVEVQLRLSCWKVDGSHGEDEKNEYRLTTETSSAVSPLPGDGKGKSSDSIFRSRGLRYSITITRAHTLAPADHQYAPWVSASFAFPLLEFTSGKGDLDG